MHPSVTPTDTAPATWSTPRKIFFRFALVFFGLILLSGLGGMVGMNTWFWDPLVNWTGRHLLGYEYISNSPSGSGDRLYDWVWHVVLLILTLIGGTLFNLLDYRRTQYTMLRVWLHALLAVYLSLVMLTYGLVKVFQLQFISPTLSQLFETYGQSSPMRLLWTFMGASRPYTVFAGLCEVIPGLLLLFRRTRMLGALMSAGVMLNVFALNVFYDVPVKLFSFQLLFISCYLLAPELPRLVNFFLLNRAVEPAAVTPLLPSQTGRRILVGVLTLLVIIFVGVMTNGFLRSQRQYGHLREKSPLYGAYTVETFVRNGDSIPPLTNIEDRWQTLLFDFPTEVYCLYTDGRRERLVAEIDTTAFQIKIGEDSLQYRRSAELLTLEGVLRGDSLSVRLSPFDDRRFLLRNRGFHWVNEVPYNEYVE